MLPEQITPEESDILKRAAKKATRVRGQSGHVEETGKKRKKWRGSYFVYVVRNGVEKRTHKRVDLGWKSELSKTDAKRKLREFLITAQLYIVEASGNDSQPLHQDNPIGLLPSPTHSLRDFWSKVFRPMKEPTWKESGRKELIGNIERYVLAKFGDWELGSINKIALQLHVNELAARYSKSVVEKALIWSRAIMEEAAELDFIPRNPGKRLVMPETREVQRPVVSLIDLHAKFARLPLRERLILRMSLILGLRPSEKFALKRDDVNGQSLRIDEGNRYGKLYRTKTKSSKANVWLTPDILAELNTWMALQGSQPSDALLFPNTDGKPMRLDNYRKRHFKPALKAAGLAGVTMQMCRRSCGTFMNDGKHGNVKDIQGHLRHAQASTTMDIYVQEVPESIRHAVESLDRALFGAANIATSVGNRC